MPWFSCISNHIIVILLLFPVCCVLCCTHCMCFPIQCPAEYIICKFVCCAHKHSSLNVVYICVRRMHKCLFSFTGNNFQWNIHCTMLSIKQINKHLHNFREIFCCKGSLISHAVKRASAKNKRNQWNRYVFCVFFFVVVVLKRDFHLIYGSFLPHNKMSVFDGHTVAFVWMNEWITMLQMHAVYAFYVATNAQNNRNSNERRRATITNEQAKKRNR